MAIAAMIFPASVEFILAIMAIAILLIGLLVLVISGSTKKQYMRQIRANDLEMVRKSGVIGRIDGCFKYSVDKGGEWRSACDALFMQDCLVFLYKKGLNTISGTFGYAPLEIFRESIAKSKVIPGNPTPSPLMEADPGYISGPIPYNSVSYISLSYLAMENESAADKPEVRLTLMHVRIGGTITGDPIDIVFAESEFGNAVDLLSRTALREKLRIKRETIRFNMEIQN